MGLADSGLALSLQGCQ